MESTRIAGVRIDLVTLSEAVEIIGEFLKGPGFHQVATVNPEFVVAAQHDAEFRATLEGCDLNLPDGANLVRAARLLGAPVRGRVGGADLTWELARYCAATGKRLYLFGAREGVAAEAAAMLTQEFPGLAVVGTRPGSPEAEHDSEQVAEINSSGADVLLVAFGAPAQDFWIRRNHQELAVRVAIGVGGTFDYLSGRVKRAPEWMQRAGFEWLYRLYRQPWRWRRQLRGLEFLALVAREMIRGRTEPGIKGGRV